MAISCSHLLSHQTPHSFNAYTRYVKWIPLPLINETKSQKNDGVRDESCYKKYFGMITDSNVMYAETLFYLIISYVVFKCSEDHINDLINLLHEFRCHSINHHWSIFVRFIINHTRSIS